VEQSAEQPLETEQPDEQTPETEQSTEQPSETESPDEQTPEAEQSAEQTPETGQPGEQTPETEQSTEQPSETEQAAGQTPETDTQQTEADAEIQQTEADAQAEADVPQENEPETEQPESEVYPETKADFDFSDEKAINDINDKLRNQGYQIQPIGDVDVGDLEDNFWNSSGKGGGTRNESAWEQNMQNYPEILNRINQGQSLEEIRNDETLRPTCNTLFNDNDPIRLDTSDPDNIRVPYGRHRIAMAQRLGFTHLPIKQ